MSVVSEAHDHGPQPVPRYLDRLNGRDTEQEKELGMPRYEFLCEKCQKPFEMTMTISEHEKGNVRCPTCKSTRVVPQLSGFMGRSAKKS